MLICVCSLSKASPVSSMKSMTDTLTDSSGEDNGMSARLQDWLASPRSDEPRNGIPDESAPGADEDTTSAAISNSATVFPVKTSLSASNTKTSPRLEDWLAAGISKDVYIAGKPKRALNEGRSALYAEIDEILTAFQMNRPMFASAIHQGTQSESSE